MADPSVYNAILEQNKQLQNNIQQERCYVINSLSDAETRREEGAAAAVIQAAIQALDQEPWNTANWSFIPLLADPVGCLCVYDNFSGNLRCGVACTWTVPGGATKAQFQVWGAGAGTANGMCCAGSPFGQNGAFATTIIDVTPGDTYTLCAGCAFCCYAYCSSQNTTCGNPSWVQGTNLSNFCADGGCSRISCGMRDYHSCCRQQGYGQCRWRGNQSSDSSGPCICAGGSWYCFDNSCASCGIVPFIRGVEQQPRGTATGSTVYGLPGTWGGGCFDRNHYGCMCAPPVIGPCHTAQPNSCRVEGFTSGSCCGGCRCTASTGYRAYPGAGGTYTHMMGGSQFWSGDAGRGGMVRVTWC